MLGNDNSIGSVSDENVDDYIEKMNDLKAKLYDETKTNIKIAQERQKKDYDKKRRRFGVSTKMFVCSVYFLITNYYFMRRKIWSEYK